MYSVVFELEEIPPRLRIAVIAGVVQLDQAPHRICRGVAHG
jgi:hypothetical protein